MRIVFMGTPAFAVPTLQQLLKTEYSVVGVVCQPDRPSGRGKKVQVGPVKALAQSQGIPVVQPEKMKDPKLMEILRTWEPDVVVVAAFGRILPKTARACREGRGPADGILVVASGLRNIGVKPGSGA